MAPTNTYCDYAAGNDYKGASFTDGAYTSATKTLVKADAFTANKVNNWLYLESNDGGSIVAGYYLIATWTDASTVILATDAGAGVDDDAVKCTQADGSTSLPWHSVQGALDLTTRDATNGDQINVKAGNTDIVAAALSLTTYGTPTAAAPLIIRGYTSSAGDGGIGVLSGGGNNRSIIDSSTLDYIHFIDMRLTNCGTSTVARVDSYCMFLNCQVDTSTGHGLFVGANCLVERCNIYDVATAAAKSAIYCNGGGVKVLRNRIYSVLSSTSFAVYGNGATCIVEGNIIRISNVGDAIYNGTGGDGLVTNHNSIYAAAGTGSGINAVSGADNVVVTNNIVEGFSGSGGKGITIAGTAMLYHSNAIYNCATAESITGVVFGYNANNDTIASSAFVNAASDDFDINGTVSGVTEDAWPSAFLGASSTTPKADKGASQAGAGAGGGGTVNPLRGKLG